MFLGGDKNNLQVWMKNEKMLPIHTFTKKYLKISMKKKIWSLENWSKVLTKISSFTLYPTYHNSIFAYSPIHSVEKREFYSNLEKWSGAKQGMKQDAVSSDHNIQNEETR